MEAGTRGPGCAGPPSPIVHLFWGTRGKFLHVAGTCLPICKMGTSRGLEAEAQR